MITKDERGSLNVLLIPLIVVVLVLGATVWFGYWAYSGRQDYKNNSDQKVDAAVTKAVTAEDAKKNAQFAQDEKNPLKVYQGPSAYGSIKLSYPKTWSGYVNSDGSGLGAVDGYFYPGVVPNIQSQSNSFAVRLQVVAQSYSQVMRAFQNNITTGSVKVTPYALPKVPAVIGSRVDGAILQDRQGSMIVLPMRDKTLKLWTEAPAFLNDFNTNILPNFTFSP